MRKLAVLLVLSAPAAAGEPRPIVIGERITVHSELLSEDREIRIHLPRGYDWSGSETRYPVVYLLDGETNFHHTTGTLDTLSRLGYVPDLIVVAVDNTDRTRDLTPPRVTEVPPEGDDDRFPTSGGADRFLDFFERELMPHVESSYRAAPHRILIGHSFGGLFAVHTFVHRTDLFDAYLAISPSLWWDEARLVGEVKALFASRPDLKKRLFVSLADEAEVMRPPYKAFIELLRYEAPAGLDWEALDLVADDHGTTTIRSTNVGIRALFPRWRLPSSETDGGLEAIERHYARLSEDYGYPVSVPERQINALGQRLLREKKADEARAIFEVNAARFPDSANVHDSLGEALEALGDLEAAQASFERAVELAEKAGQPNLAVYREHLARVRKAFVP